MGILSLTTSAGIETPHATDQKIVEPLPMYLIEDQLHAESIGEFGSLAEVANELQRLAALPWDQPPNLAPCADWATCGRDYEVIEYDATQQPWRELSRVSALSVSAAGVVWMASDLASPRG
jgi:hypothetical protein